MIVELVPFPSRQNVFMIRRLQMETSTRPTANWESSWSGGRATAFLEWLVDKTQLTFLEVALAPPGLSKRPIFSFPTLFSSVLSQRLIALP